MKYFFIPVALASAAILSCAYAASQPPGTCILPSPPAYGQYKVNGVANPDPATAYDRVSLNYSCNPGYIALGNSDRICIQGVWSDDEPKCVQCGIISPVGEPLRRRRSTSARIGDMPWHATVYSKKTTPYKQQCTATLVTSKAVLSVAHCFWDNLNNKPLPAQDFAVAVGKIYRSWNAVEDQFAQKSNVSDIKIPSRFRGLATNYQDDISVIILATEITFNSHVRPVCLEFSEVFERRQLQANKSGRIASWAPTGPNKKHSLEVLEVPFIPTDECLSSSPPEFREYITSDKFCAGSRNGTGLCRGNSGAGISFPELDKGRSRYYLRGIASTSPSRSDEDYCNHSLILFTQISKHEGFIKEFI